MNYFEWKCRGTWCTSSLFVRARTLSTTQTCFQSLSDLHIPNLTRKISCKSVFIILCEFYQLLTPPKLLNPILKPKLICFAWKLKHFCSSLDIYCRQLEIKLISFSVPLTTARYESCMLITFV